MAWDFPVFIPFRERSHNNTVSALRRWRRDVSSVWRSAGTSASTEWNYLCLTHFVQDIISNDSSVNEQTCSSKSAWFQRLFLLIVKVSGQLRGSYVRVFNFSLQFDLYISLQWHSLYMLYMCACGARPCVCTEATEGHRGTDRRTYVGTEAGS